MRDLWRGKLSHRRLWVLIKHLPPESWTQTRLRDLDVPDLVAEEPAEREFGPWSQGDHLAAALIDAVNHNTYVTVLAAGGKDYPVPTPLPRPGPRRTARPQSELSQAAVIYLNARRAPRGVG